MNTIPETPLTDQRRAIFERVLSRYAASGLILDDPALLRLMEAWIVGEIEMIEATAHWNSVRISRVEERRSNTRAAQYPALSQDPLGMIASQIEEDIAGGSERTPRPTI
ncbi:hypothetical protein [Rhizobium sp. BK376]|uniref:hypothetical protein n=1 Tax=Rhizobium sp. BK376 TaxID=2512149 RepID=UPI0010437F16|nr:hypothetical protein [Rhizobium sp. BK376]TCR66688.1 hypothetical protein EV561_1547 [Rhizobium sp. BK376]